MSWKPEQLVQGKWYSNGLCFATQQEAESNARDLYARWTQSEGSRAVESDQPVNHRYVDGQLINLENEK